MRFAETTVMAQAGDGKRHLPDGVALVFPHAIDGRSTSRARAVALLC
jgi:hypothetical protein